MNTWNLDEYARCTFDPLTLPMAQKNVTVSIVQMQVVTLYKPLDIVLSLFNLSHALEETSSEASLKNSTL
jgi:hypothetical protein